MRASLAAVVLLAMLIAPGTAQLSFGPIFSISNPTIREGAQLVVRLSAPILTRSFAPAFTGRIEVVICAEDLPAGDTRLKATLGSDYIVTLQDFTSRNFTVTFLSKQANSTEYVIIIADDQIFEGREYFRLRIKAIRIIGQAAQFYVPQPGFENTFVDVNIEDDDVIRVNFTTSRAITVTEGDVVRLRGRAFGVYANPVAIGVDCSETIATDVEPALPGRDFNFTVGTKLHFTDIGDAVSNSSDQVVIPIINDDIAEPRESFICTLQGGTVDSVQAIFPSQVTIEIRDDDELIVRWAQDFYMFQECEKAIVELVTDSDFEADQVAISGRPRRIPDSDPSTLPSIEVPGPDIIPGVIIRSSIEQVQAVTGERGVFGKAQVTLSGRTDVESTSNDFIFTSGNKSAFECFNIINDSVLEFDELLIATFDFGPEIESNWNARKGTPSTTYILIRDKNSVEVCFNESSYSFNESEGQVTVSLRITGQFFFVPMYAVIEVSDGTATDPEDYSSAGFYTVEFRQTVFTDTDTPAPFADSLPITINITDDTIFEGLEYFQARIVNTSDLIRVMICPNDTVNVTIIDDENATVSFSPQNYTVPEGTPAELMIILDMPAVDNFTIIVTTMDITAESPNDYTGRNFSVLVPAGSAKVTLNVDTVTDNILEDAEFFKATLTIPDAPDNVVVGSPNMAFVTIVDATTRVRFNPSNYTVKEGVDSNAVITLEALDEHPDFGFTVTVVTQDGSAIRGSDYEGDRFNVFFPAGANVISFNVTIIDDVIAECAELFTLVLEIPEASADMGVIKVSPDTATVNIRDDDVEELMISLDSDEYSVREDVGFFTATITATREADFPYTVTVDSADGTAVVGDDYQQVQLQIEFMPGDTRKEFNVTIVDDNVIEELESFQLSLSIKDDITSKGVQLGPNDTATVTIIDNDVQVMFSKAEEIVSEDDGQAPVSVVAMGDLSSTFSIIVMAINGTAIENSDFTGNMWRVNFPAGFTEQGFTIPIIRDTSPELQEMFSLKIVIESPLDQRVTVGMPSMLVIQITDPNNATIQGDPLFSIPLPEKYINDTKMEKIQLCFEVHGVAGKHYNLISDSCTSVSAKYSQGVSKTEMHVITEIGVKTQGGNDTCHSVEVDLEKCSAYLDGVYKNTTSTIKMNRMIMKVRRHRVRVSLPNCENSKRFVMWALCTRRHSEDMMELVVARGDGLEPTAHGLLGQFWNIPLTIVPYVGPYGGRTVGKSDKKYMITIFYPGAPKRTFVADYGDRDWYNNRHCLYAGDREGGKSGEVSGYDSVIQGKSSDYIVDGLFSTDFEFSKYNGKC